MTDEPCVLGIDPGASGAIAFIFPSHTGLVSAEDVPLADGLIDGATLAMRLEQMRPNLAVIESVHAMPGQGVTSMFKFGQAFGTVIGVVSALKIPVRFITPGKWKKHYGLSADKEEARARALHLWPSRAELFARKKDHGRAEASLLALYGAEIMLGGAR